MLSRHSDSEEISVLNAKENYVKVMTFTESFLPFYVGGFFCQQSVELLWYQKVSVCDRL